MKNGEIRNLVLIVFPIGFLLGFLTRGFVWHEQILTSKLLDWPFLAFFLIGVCVVAFFQPLGNLIARGEVTIGWGKDQSVKISNLSSAVSAELAPLQEEIDALKIALADLRVPVPAPTIPPVLLVAGRDRVADITALTESSDAELRERKKRLIREALDNPKYKWRTLDKLSSIVGDTEDEVCELLLTMDDVRTSRSMTGRLIAGLRSRVGAP